MLAGVFAGASKANHPGLQALEAHAGFGDCGKRQAWVTALPPRDGERAQGKPFRTGDGIPNPLVNSAPHMI